MAETQAQSAVQLQRTKRQQEREGLDFFRYASRRLITSLLLYGLLVEWLLPLRQLERYTELQQVGPLLLAAGLFLAVGLFVPPTWAALLLNGTIATVTVLLLFDAHYHSVTQAYEGLLRALQHDVIAMAHGEMMLSGETRTLLLVGGLGMMAIAVQSLVWLRQWGLGLTALTAVYLLLLYGFLGLNVFQGMLRALTEGILLSVLVTLPRVERTTGTSNAFAAGKKTAGLAGWSMGWWSGAAWLIAILLFAGIGAAWSWSGGMASKPAPWAEDAVAWGQARLGDKAAKSVLTGTTAQEAMAKSGLTVDGETGYGFDDRSLGAPLATSDKVMFTVASREAGYLRGESKATYTGRGWQQDAHDWQTVEVAHTAPANGAFVQVQTVSAADPIAGMPLLTGGTNANISALRLLHPSSGISGAYRRDLATDALYLVGDAGAAISYTVETELPDVKALQEANEGNGTALQEASVGGGVESSVAESESGGTAASTRTSQHGDADMAAYTQLPDGLPARIGALAAQIIADAGSPASRYGKAQAIADYLRSHYGYTLQATSVPQKDADFVDDFLFRQKQGYCVHFASAMVVLLRTQGIPARYVKGFAPGEESRPAGSGEAALFTVRARDAHAWVEVWFPGVGWAAMEPTPGFAAPGSGAAGEAAPVAGASGAFAQPRGSAAAGGEAGHAWSGEAASARGFAGRMAAQLQAAAERGADALAGATKETAKWLRAASQQVAEELRADAPAGAAQRVMTSPPWTKAVGAATAVGAAGLLLAVRRKRERFAFGSALRRYRSALEAGRHTAARSQFLALADDCWRELYKQCGAKPSHRTAREYAAALQLPPQTALLVADFVRWDEGARYAAHGTPLPTFEQLSDLIVGLQHRN